MSRSMLHKLVTDALPRAVKKGKDDFFCKYVKQLWDRPFTNINEEWTVARKYPGVYQRVHSDCKSSGGGVYSFFIAYEKGGDGGPDRRMLVLMGGNRFVKENILLKGDISNVKDMKSLDSKTFKQAVRELLEEANVDSSIWSPDDVD